MANEPGEDAPPDAVTADAFRDVIGRFATGVTVVTARDDDGDHGMTANAVSSVSLEPPTLLVCVDHTSRTGTAAQREGRFTVNVLAEDQADLAHRFAAPIPDRFEGVAVTRRPRGTLALDGALATIDCEVDGGVSVATHRILLGRVVDVSVRHGDPLAYFRGQFGAVHVAGTDATTAALRGLLLDARTSDDTVLDVPALAAALSVDRARVDRALSALRREGLVSGDPVRGYRVAPAEGRAIDDALVARGAIELGAAELAVGRTGPAELAELRRLADRTVAVLGDGPVDVAAYADANTRFHEALVRTAGSPGLLEAYRHLALPGILIRGVTDPGRLVGALADDHVAIAGAWADGDLDAVRAAIASHSERTRRTHAEAAG